MKLFATFLKACFAVGLVPVAMALSGCSDNNTTEPNGNTLGAAGTLYVTEGGGNKYVYGYNLATGTSQDLSLLAHNPCLTPDGTVVCVVPVKGLVEYSPNNSPDTRTRVIVNQREMGDPFDNNFNSPQVSSDGKYIAYNGNSNSTNPGIFIVDRYQTDKLLHTIYDYTDPTWTPDGRIVVIGVGSKSLFISNSTFTSFEKIETGMTSHLQPRVSPDGKKVAFVSDNRIYTVNIDGSGVRQLSTVDRKETWPVWSPDSKWIAFYQESTRIGSSIVLFSLEKSESIDIATINSKFKPDLTGQFDWGN